MRFAGLPAKRRRSAIGPRSKPQPIFSGIKCGAANWSSISGTISSAISIVETGAIDARGVQSHQTACRLLQVPRPADLNPASRDDVVTSTNLGIRLAGRPEGNPLRPGAWYTAEGNRGIYVSVLRPDLIAPQILRSYPTLVRPLDRVETSALCFFVAFDLDQFDLAYARGTEHPAVGWSEHIQPQMRIPSLPGPDGIGSIAPLVSTGLVNPEDVPRTVATFTGGFKREQGAFKFGALATAKSRQPLRVHRTGRGLQQAPTGPGHGRRPRRRVDGHEDLAGHGQPSPGQNQICPSERGAAHRLR